MAGTGALRRIAGFGEVAAKVHTNYAAPLHTHEGYSIGIFHGPARIWCRDDCWDVASGLIVILEPGEPHRGTPLSRHCAQDMLLPDILFTTATFGTAAPFAFPTHLIADSDLAESLSEAAARGDGHLLGEATRRLFLRHGKAAPSHARRTDQRQAEALQVLASESSIAAASRATGISRSHFSRRVRASSGLPPRDLRRQMRVAHARGLIEAGESLAAAAIDAGFADQAHMTRQVRSLLGVTPAALRDSAARERR